MVALFPDLVMAAADIAPGGKLKPLEHPVFAAFMNLVDCLEYPVRRMALKITYDIGKVISFCPEDTMHVIGHHDITENFESLILPAIGQAVNDDVPIHLS